MLSNNIDHDFAKSQTQNFQPSFSAYRGISKCHSVCSTAQLMLSLEFSFPINLKIEIHVFVPSTEPSHLPSKE